MENPFKFGTIVEGDYFTDRTKEVEYISQYINSANHLILISPRRFGKSSVVMKAVKMSGREYISLNLQQVVSVADMAAKLLRELFRLRPLERLRHFITHFRIMPTLTTNPVTGAIDVSFQPMVDGNVLLEDVMALIENSFAESSRIVVILDEFQEIRDISPNLDKQLRSIMQQQKNVNYILLGSQESMMTEIFENKKSPFYHFGELMRLRKLPRDDFFQYLDIRLQPYFPKTHSAVANQILDYTDCHPYYSQQLAAHVWQLGLLQPDVDNVIDLAVTQIVENHGLDYERLWMNFTRTQKWILQRLAKKEPLQIGEYRTSTIYSALKKMQKDGYVIYSTNYEFEDPFFRQWLLDSLK